MSRVHSLKLLVRILLLLSGLASVSAYGVQITSAVAATIAYRDCSSTTCDSFDQVASLGYADFTVGGAASVVGNDSTMPPTFTSDRYDGTTYLGSGSAAAIPTGDFFAPELKVAINSVEGSAVRSQAYIIQRYVNTGDVPIQVALRLAADWSIADLAPPSGSLTFGLGYDALIFENTSGVIDVPTITDSEAFLLLSALSPDVVYHRASDTRTSSGSEVFTSPLITLGAGEGFFVGSRLVAFAKDGMSIDAFNTLRGTFIDENGNVLDGTGAFRAVVTKPGSLIQGLVEAVLQLNLQKGISNSLDAKLDAALGALDDSNENNDVAAVNTMNAFISATEAQRGKTLTSAQADELIAQANKIIDQLEN